MHRSRVYTAALEKELVVELERERRRLESGVAVTRKTDEVAAAETERQKRIRRGQAAQAARQAAVGIARAVREAARQADHDERTGQVLARLQAAQEDLHEELRRARESADAGRRRRQVETEVQSAARLAAAVEVAGERDVSAAARIDDLGSKVQAVIAERRQLRASRMDGLTRHQEAREEHRQK